MSKAKGLVWCLTEPALPNWLTPRDCPRVGYRAIDSSSEEDIARFFSSTSRHCVVIERDWLARMLTTTLFVYEFDSVNFYFDETAGFYVSDQTEVPISVTVYNDLFGELFRRDVEIRILNNLWELASSIQQSTLKWSLCRMKYAKAKPM